ncbi:ABC transporter ATP-binding protein [Bacillus sp. A301a_S52]|nr:ABC transporter ATP-binding protein [Bacillus sp. A301a_S52]
MKINHLSKNIQGVQVLEDIDFSIGKGSIIGIIGRNGAGKTTLLRTMVGIIDPTHGDVTIDGESIFENPVLKAQIVFVPDSSEALKNYSTEEILTMYSTIYPAFDKDYFYELMTRFSLPAVKKISAYSKGMKALFSLVIAFATNASYILLDEPTDGLDVIVKKRVLKVLIEEVAVKDVSVIISSHRLDELEYIANSIIMLKDGIVHSHYELDDLKLMYQKIQVVLPSKMPDTLTDKLTIINQTGRVYTIILNKEDEALIKLIKENNPLLFEELPLSLEDLFIAKLGGQNDVS